uniref:PHD-type domain-containing protein n=1 Tax=Heliothis virescens TaxID=7102 RepID=A0A2A4JY72_HELVI
MSKCNKVKNPCKICLGPVSHKNGLQCQGACQTWVHYNCLNYTPGKIKDIKAGIIKVTCPCPDCKTTMPKEFRTDQPYSCTNSMCPANRPPKCDNMQCPINDGNGRQVVRQPPSCPLSKCGNDCKTYSTPQFSNPQSQASCPSPPPQPCAPPRYNGGMSPMSSSDACLNPAVTNRCPSGCSSNQEVQGDTYDKPNNNYDMGMPSFHVVEQMCNTVGQLTNQINDLMLKMKEACNRQGNSGGGGGGGGGCCPKSPKATCPQKGPKSMCPKPCYCPGNPARRQ